MRFDAPRGTDAYCEPNAFNGPVKQQDLCRRMTDPTHIAWVVDRGEMPGQNGQAGLAGTCGGATDRKRGPESGSPMESAHNAHVTRCHMSAEPCGPAGESH